MSLLVHLVALCVLAPLARDVWREGEGRRFIGIEREPAYLDIAAARLRETAREVA